ncbi:MAG: TraR/DksA C4-type zinc finger protein [Formosimonas sp.]|jgi:phage/conjugal plasmid C-4 type zinc finger TraR family protein
MTTEKMYELSAVLEQAVRDEGLQQARAALQGVGCDECVDCGEDIATARKKAMPSATRCLDCQEQHERVIPHGDR